MAFKRSAVRLRLAPPAFAPLRGASAGRPASATETSQGKKGGEGCPSKPAGRRRAQHAMTCVIDSFAAVMAKMVHDRGGAIRGKNAKMQKWKSDGSAGRRTGSHRQRGCQHRGRPPARETFLPSRIRAGVSRGYLRRDGRADA